jgi:hypothetical protein
MRAPHTHRLGNFLDRGHLAAQCAGAACSAGCQVAVRQVTAPACSRKGERIYSFRSTAEVIGV